MLIALILACRPDPTATIDDTSYWKSPRLEEAAIRCVSAQEGDAVRLTARSIGWHESAVADLWTDPADLYGTHVAVPLVSVGFRRDEYCDVMLGEIPLDTLGAESCDTLDLGSLMVLVRVNDEENCAGCALWGPDPGALAEVPTLSAGNPLAIIDRCQTTPGWDVEDCDVPYTVSGEVESCEEMETTRW